jgi:hypothetical protein
MIVIFFTISTEEEEAVQTRMRSLVAEPPLPRLQMRFI